MLLENSVLLKACCTIWQPSHIHHTWTFHHHQWVESARQLKNFAIALIQVHVYSITKHHAAVVVGAETL